MNEFRVPLVQLLATSRTSNALLKTVQPVLSKKLISRKGEDKSISSVGRRLIL